MTWLASYKEEVWVGSTFSRLRPPKKEEAFEALGDGLIYPARELVLAQSKLSFCRSLIRNASLLSNRQQGRWMHHRLQPEALLWLRDWLDQLADGCATPAQPCP